MSISWIASCNLMFDCKRLECTLVALSDCTSRPFYWHYARICSWVLVNLTRIFASKFIATISNRRQIFKLWKKVWKTQNCRQFYFQIQWKIHSGFVCLGVASSVWRYEKSRSVHFIPCWRLIWQKNIPLYLTCSLDTVSHFSLRFYTSPATVHSSPSIFIFHTSEILQAFLA